MQNKPGSHNILFSSHLKLIAFCLLGVIVLCFVHPIFCQAEEVLDPVAKLNSLRKEIDQDKLKAKQEKLKLQAHMQKCQGFLSTLNSSKDAPAISVTKQAIKKDEAAIAKVDEHMKEIEHRLKLTERAKQYLTGGQTKGIGLSCQEIKGDVFMIRGGKKIRLHDGMFPAPGDKIITAENSHVKLMALDGSKIYLRPNSTFELIESRFDGSVSQVLKGKVGFFIAKVKLMNKRRFQVRTPTCAVAVRGTKFDIEVDEQGLTHIDVQDGTVEVTKTIILEKGQTWTEK